MAYINQDFHKALHTLQAWSKDIALSLSASLETEDGNHIATYFAQIPDEVIVEIRHSAGLLHAASLTLSALVGTDSSLLEPMRQSASDLNHFAGFLLYILDNAEPRKAE